ncbi:unnamed protein product [Caenorhabditis sp. 36 PRJEB53466]|nr:unnamed protein product [Caenorhabditis sp. 36 PRJEB53466]
MSQVQDSSESSGYSTSASSEFGSVDDQFKFPICRGSTKRKAESNIENLDELMREALTLSPEKRARMNIKTAIPRSLTDEPTADGRPQTRRSSSSDVDVSPRVRTLRAANSGNSIDIVRNVSAVSSDSISPKLLQQYSSPKKRISLNENGSVYSRHRLGSTFSPLVAGATKKVGSAVNYFKAHVERPLRSDSPRLSKLRKSGVIRMKRPLSDRLKGSFE